MKLMQYNRIPRKYHLVWDIHEKTILIRVHRDCLQFTRVVPDDAPIVQGLIEMHEFDTMFDIFSGNLATDFFGFNRTVCKTRDTGDYIEFKVLIPKVKTQLHLACEHCDGHGHSCEEHNKGDRCLYCSGTGRQCSFDWKSAFAVTSSLSLLFTILDFNEETAAAESQLATIDMVAQMGQHGSSINGCFGVDFLDYILTHRRELNGVILRNVTEAMKSVHDHMFGLEPYDHLTIRAESSDGSVGLTVPGDACGINTGFHGRSEGEGREFSCHNVDSPLQSLALLAGIASFVGQVDENISIIPKLTVV